TLGGVPVPLFFVSPGQANIYVPRELEGLTSALLTPARSGVEGPASEVELTPFAPGVFTLDQSGRGQGAVLIAGTGLTASQAGSVGGRPARRGEALEVFATGLGPVIEGADGLQRVVEQPSARIGEESARV